MDKNSRDKKFIRKPIFKGGNKEFSKFLYGNLKYPKAAKEAKVEGIVIVRFDINHKGNVIKTKIISSLGHGCDEEAARVIKLMKFDIPKGPRNLKVIFHRTTKVKFVLPKEKVETDASNSNSSLSYQYVKKKVVLKDSNQNQKKKTYNYDVSW